MDREEVEVLVVGAGVAGLAAALTLEARGFDVLLADAADVPGGVMRSDRVAGFLVERGPNTIQVKPPIRALLAAQNLEQQLARAAPESRQRCLFRAGKLLPVPMDPLALVTTPLLSARAKWRLLAEPGIKRGDAAGESVAEFVGRRLGPEVVSALVGPFLTGVYAGDEEELGAEAVFPGLVEFERASGSIVRGALSPRRLIDSQRRAQPGLRGIWSTEAGLGGLAEALAAQLSRPPRLNSRARSVRREDEVWAVQFDDAELRAGQLILATPAREAAELLGKVSPDAAEILSQIEYAPVVSIALGTQPGASERPIEGFGFLVPRDAKLSLLGCLFMSRLFPKRAPEGRELLQCMVGGTRYRAAVECPEDQLVAALHADLERTLGLRAEPEVLQVMRWPRAVPQPGRRHPERMAALRKALDSQPGLQLAGAYLAGVSVADSGASGVRAAQQIGEG